MTDMTEKPEWKKALRESNAIGWIGFLVLVIAIGVGTIYFGSAAPAGHIGQSDQAAK